jgi:hypothetical protein
VIIDALPDPDDEQDPRALAAYALSLGIRTGKGRPDSEGTFRTWLTDAGMVDLRRVDPPGPTVVAAVVGSAQKREAFL